MHNYLLERRGKVANSYGIIKTSRNKVYALAGCTCQCPECTNGVTNQNMRNDANPFKPTAGGYR